MMDDIVERLRKAANQSVMDYGEHWNLEDEAADEIERYRAVIAELISVLKPLSTQPKLDVLHSAQDLIAKLDVLHSAQDLIAKYDKSTTEEI